MPAHSTCQHCQRAPTAAATHPPGPPCRDPHSPCPARDAGLPIFLDVDSRNRWKGRAVQRMDRLASGIRGANRCTCYFPPSPLRLGPVCSVLRESRFPAAHSARRQPTTTSTSFTSQAMLTAMGGYKLCGFSKSSVFQHLFAKLSETPKCGIIGLLEFFRFDRIKN